MYIKEPELYIHPLSYSGPYQKGIEVAEYYGFKVIAPLRGVSTIHKEMEPRNIFHKAYYLDPAEKILTDEYITSLNAPKSVQHMLCQTRNAKKKDGGGINLNIVGSSKSISEALIIKTAISILEEHGKSNFVIELNSLGDQNSYKLFIKDLMLYYRKNINEIGDCCRTHMKNNPALLTICHGETCREIRKDAPRPINYLSESSRNHLKSIIEYLESMGLQYRINNDLIGEDYATGTQISFVIKENDSNNPCEQKVLARGERYNRYTHNNQQKKIFPTVGISIDINESGKESYKEEGSRKNPDLYLVHLGTEAKRQSLQLIELLRKKNIQIAQSLIHDDLSKQIQRAEYMHVAHTLIIGVKEAREQTVIIRNTDTRAQEVVPVDKLIGYLRHVHRL